MKIKQKDWFFLISFAVIGFFIWLLFTYPRFSFINLSVGRPAALEIAENYLKDRSVDPSRYSHATIFVGAPRADQYLQKAIGFEKELEFVREHKYELFAWKTRFYREEEKEEFRVTVSAATGEVIGFTHTIEASAHRPDEGEDKAKERAIAFLKQKFDFNPEDYLLHSHLAKIYDYRKDYTFVWEKKGIFIEWSDEPNTGGAKLLIAIRVSGEEILHYTKAKLDIPNQFHRYIASLKTTGHNLALIFRILFFSLLTASIFFVVVRRNDLVMHTTKWFCVTITCVMFGLSILAYFNQFENVLYGYKTTSSFISYFYRHITQYILDAFIVTISILMPCLAGESLRYEVLPKKKESSFLYFINTSFFCRNIFWSVLVGYLAAMIMIGIQSAAFETGQRYLGVWVEYTWMAQLSANYLPFVAAFILSFSASATEEIAFRLFSINLGKKFLKNTFLAVLLASILWGYGHSTYLIFPMWFRGLEVTFLGLFLSLIYLRFGIIPVLVAHFVFDSFWTSSAFLLGHSTPFNFYSSIFVILIPALYGLTAYFRNAPEDERQMQWKLNKHQIYNLEVLKNYLKNNPGLTEKPKAELKKEIVAHGWDIAVVEMALEETYE